MVIDQEIRKVMKRRTKINIERKEDKDRKDLMRVQKDKTGIDKDKQEILNKNQIVTMIRQHMKIHKIKIKANQEEYLNLLIDKHKNQYHKTKARKDTP